MIFLGCLFDREKENIYLQKSKCGISNAVNGYQWNLIDGLNENLIAPVTIVNALPVGIWKRQYKDFILEDIEWSYKGSGNYEIGCINLPFIKQYQRYCRCKKVLKKINDKRIIIYSPYLPFLRAIYKLDKSYDITLVVTDLPEYYDLGRVRKLKKFFRKLNNKRVYRYMKRIDRFVILTEQMKEPLNISDRPYTVVEGICNGVPAPISQGKEKTILYTGTLHERFGIGTLLDAFSKIEDSEYKLWICGGGDMEKKIEEAAKRDSRISFFGYVPKSKINELQAEATVVVNPRQNNDEFTKYSFPSKTMEYMLSGKPVIMYKLDGVPDEYDRYLHYVEDNSAESLKNKIVSVCEQTREERNEFARRAQDFVVKEKNSASQAKKILRMIEK